MITPFEQELEKRTNPELSRKFDQDDFRRRIRLLCEIGASPPFCKATNSLRIGVVGTNGKGSVSFLLGRYFEEMGFRTGVYTSPHLLNVFERIRYDGEAIDPDAALSALHEMYGLLPDSQEQFTYFEILTLLALYVFKKNGCDREVYEAGLGGNYDATRIAASDVVILTSVSLDHTALLGDTCEKILHEKLGIITQNAKTFFFIRSPRIASDTIRTGALALNSALAVHEFPDPFYPDCESYRDYNDRFVRFVLSHLDRKSPLPSAHSGSPQNDPLPGRMESFSIVTGDDRRVTILFDTAHNPEGVETVAIHLRHLLNVEPEKTLFLIASVVDRNILETVDILKRYGFLHFRQIAADGLSAAHEELERAAEPFLNQDSKAMFHFIETHPFTTIVMIGTHRIYPLFHALRNHETR